MCARYTLFTPGAAIAEQFRLAQVPALVPRYNVAPSQLVAVVGTKASGTGRGLAMFRWGFIPNWAATATGARPVNAKAETVAEKPSFRDSFRHRRCLIPADGFYEWRSTPEGKRPLFYRLKGAAVMALAGIWDVWAGPTEKLFTCAIVTTSANPLVEPVHDRMPVILPPESWDAWLNPQETDAAKLLPLLQPFPAEQMEFVPASPVVNSSRHEGPDCLSAPDEPEPNKAA
jgi:putative SOS response-associated peptidase YedK